jgi:hypothetical protein
MNKIILILTLLLSVNVVAQNPEKRERIKALKVAFITEKLQLTESEAQKFWPVYNAFEESTHKYRRDFYKQRNTDVANLSEQEAKTILNGLIKTEKEKHKLKEQFMADLLKILPAKKIIKLKITEDEFNKQMLEQYKKRKESKD